MRAAVRFAFVIFANNRELTDGTGDVQSRDVSGLAGSLFGAGPAGRVPLGWGVHLAEEDGDAQLACACACR